MFYFIPSPVSYRIQSLARKLVVSSLLCLSMSALAQQSTSVDDASDQTPADATAEAKAQQFNRAASGIDQRLTESLAELDALSVQIREEKLPLAATLRELEEQLKETRREFEKVSRQAASRAQQEQTLKDQIEGREKQAGFIANRLDEYIREFEAGLHIAELQRYEGSLEAAKLAMENRDLSSRDRFDVQKQVVEASIDRLQESMGGVRYGGSAIDTSGVLGTQGASVLGTFIQLGPVVVFSDSTGELQGTIEQKIGTLLPEVIPFANPENALAVKALAETSQGQIALDTTLGEAQVIEQIDEATLEDELRAGGPVMYPILGLAALTLLVGLYKWMALTLTPSPSQKKKTKLLRAVSDNDKAQAKEIASTMRGPTGRMLRAGTLELGAPRELIEEVMYEQVLSAKIKANRLLPIVAICAAAAPLLGLLGTVSGIINTFKMMQVSGASDMQNVSGGISEALITTKFGLIVAIPALLLHVFLSRKARGVIDEMEKTGVAFINQIMKSPPSEGEQHPAATTPTPDGDDSPDQPADEDDSDASSSETQTDSAPDPSAENDQATADEKEKEPAIAGAQTDRESKG